tara:strand:+ start:2654 stop:3109 length:456 start_codon:yes stop_codon:yes gene_type:complete
MINRIIIALLSYCSIASALQADEPIVFVGEWSVDFDRTMELAKESPKYSEKDAERMPATVQRMMKMMKIRITPEELAYLRGKKEMSLPYSILESTDTKAILSVPVRGQEVTMTFTLIDDEFMNFTSSGSDDMDYYVWTKSTTQKESESESE